MLHAESILGSPARWGNCYRLENYVRTCSLFVWRRYGDDHTFCASSHYITGAVLALYLEICYHTFPDDGNIPRHPGPFGTLNMQLPQSRKVRTIILFLTLFHASVIIPPKPCPAINYSVLFPKVHTANQLESACVAPKGGVFTFSSWNLASRKSSRHQQKCMT